jgi:hypothetical protein
VRKVIISGRAIQVISIGSWNPQSVPADLATGGYGVGCQSGPPITDHQSQLIIGGERLELFGLLAGPNFIPAEATG